MESKLKFEEALKVMEDVHKIFEEMHLPNDVSSGELRFLFFLKKTETNELKKMKESICNKFSKISRSHLDVKLAKLISSLIKKGLVEKVKNPNDQRIADVHISNEGDFILNNFLKEAKMKWKEAQNS